MPEFIVTVQVTEQFRYRVKARTKVDAVFAVGTTTGAETDDPNVAYEGTTTTNRKVWVGTIDPKLEDEIDFTPASGRELDFRPEPTGGQELADNLKAQLEEAEAVNSGELTVTAPAQKRSAR